MAECIDNTVIPTLPSDTCKGERINTKCVYSDKAFTLLNIPINSSLEVILDAFVTVLVSQQSLILAQNINITTLQTDIVSLKSRVTALGG